MSLPGSHACTNNGNFTVLDISLILNIHYTHLNEVFLVTLCWMRFCHGRFPTFLHFLLRFLFHRDQSCFTAEQDFDACLLIFVVFCLLLFCVCCCCFCVFVVVLVFLVVAQNSKLFHSRAGFRNLPTRVWCLLFGLFVVFVFEDCFTAEGDFGTCLLVFGHKATADIFALLEIGRSRRGRKEKRGKALKAAQTSQPQAQQTGDVQKSFVKNVFDCQLI